VEIVEEVASNSSKENEFDCCWVRWIMSF
jgi:hypothetical protein